MDQSGIQRLQQFVSGKLNIVMILALGVALMMLPDLKQKNSAADILPETKSEIQWKESLQSELSSFLSQMDGVGRVQVMLSTAHGEKTIYQTDSNSDRCSTVLITDKDRNQNGLVNQIEPPIYQGAIVVCQGADRPAVVLAITQAVSNVTGLGFSKISVLKMK